MATDLATYGAAGLPTKKVDKETVDAMVKSGDWLPRIAITTSMSGLVMEKKVDMGKIVVIFDSERFKDLGTELEVLALDFHPRAMDTTVKPPLSFYNRNSLEFKDVAVRSETPDSGCMFGMEFLCWVPVLNQFCLFFCSSKTARRETPAILTLMERGPDEYGPAPVRITTRLVKDQKKNRSWWSFSANEMSTPLPDASEKFNQEVTEVLTDFNNPVDSKKPELAGTPQRER